MLCFACVSLVRVEIFGMNGGRGAPAELGSCAGGRAELPLPASSRRQRSLAAKRGLTRHVASQRNTPVAQGRRENVPPGAGEERPENFRGRCDPSRFFTALDGESSHKNAGRRRKFGLASVQPAGETSRDVPRDHDAPQVRKHHRRGTYLGDTTELFLDSASARVLTVEAERASLAARFMPHTLRPTL
jgi:hypothetical protein